MLLYPFALFLLGVLLQVKGFYGHKLLAVSVFCQPNPILAIFVAVEVLDDFVLIELVFEPLSLKKLGKSVFLAILSFKVEISALMILLLDSQRVENHPFISSWREGLVLSRLLDVAR